MAEINGGVEYIKTRQDELAERYLEAREISGIDSVTKSDVSPHIGLIDIFKLPQGGPHIPADTFTHGADVKIQFRSVFPRVDAVNVSPYLRMDQIDEWGEELVVAESVVDALSKFGSNPDYPLPNVINMSLGLSLPSPAAVKRDVDEHFSYKVMSPIERWAAKKIKGKAVAGKMLSQRLDIQKRLIDQIDRLRNSGVVLVSALDNRPFSMDDTEGSSVDLPSALPGVIATGAITSVGDKGWARFGNRELDQVTSVGVTKCINGEYVEGNSFSLAAVGLDMVMTKFPILKQLKPGQRENFLLEVLKDASPRMDVINRVRDENGNYVDRTEETRVLSLKVLKENLDSETRNNLYNQKINEVQKTNEINIVSV